MRTGAPPLTARAWSKLLTVVIEKLLLKISEFTEMSQTSSVRHKNQIRASACFNYEHRGLCGLLEAPLHRL